MTSTCIYVDADACPVKEEVYRVARRYGLPVRVVSNSWIRVPDDDAIELVVVDGGFDVADDWIAERAGRGDVVIADDVPLSARCIARGARVISFRGREVTEDSIGGALATRELLAHLRYLGEVSGGPAPFGKHDRSRLLQQLDATIQALRRAPADP